MLCWHAGIIDKTNEKLYKCNINYDKNFILIKDVNKYLYMNILEREKNNENELVINMNIYL